MILGLGIDLLSENRIEKLLIKFTDKFVGRVLSNEELKLFDGINEYKKINFLTKRFSAKEAFLKAVGIGMGRGITFQNISILNDKLGRPILNVDDEAMDFLNKLYNITTDNKLLFNISLTDEKGLVATVVTISK
ncbi:MAG: holo-ACP synthase [Rickettsiales bacterium]|nr:holo-ACP synthase [Rickettsiales bacterium]